MEVVPESKKLTTDQFRYIRIQPKTPEPQHEALGNKPHKLCIYFPEPRTEVFCFRLNFNISKLAYSAEEWRGLSLKPCTKLTTSATREDY